MAGKCSVTQFCCKLIIRIRWQSLCTICTWRVKYCELRSLEKRKVGVDFHALTNSLSAGASPEMVTRWRTVALKVSTNERRRRRLHKDYVRSGNVVIHISQRVAQGLRKKKCFFHRKTANVLIKCSIIRGLAGFGCCHAHRVWSKLKVSLVILYYDIKMDIKPTECSFCTSTN